MKVSEIFPKPFLFDWATRGIEKLRRQTPDIFTTAAIVSETEGAIQRDLDEGAIPCLVKLGVAGNLEDIRPLISLEEARRIPGVSEDMLDLLYPGEIDLQYVGFEE